MKNKIKEHVKRNKGFYIGFGSGAIAVFTLYIMRNESKQINRGIAVVAKRGIAVQGKTVTMQNVSFINSLRQGSPSWVVRCKETGAIFTSQRSAAIEMGIPENELSRHLNGLREHVRGFHFERICMAA